MENVHRIFIDIFFPAFLDSLKIVQVLSSEVKESEISYARGGVICHFDKKGSMVRVGSGQMSHYCVRGGVRPNRIID